jgi:hypothetical protein
MAQKQLYEYHLPSSQPEQKFYVSAYRDGNNIHYLEDS